jgi:ribosome-associated protein
MEAIDRQTRTKSVTQGGGRTIPAAELAHRIVDIAADKKASDIALIDIQPVSYMADYFVICTGESERQIKAIVDALTETLRKQGIRPLHSEGAGASGWVLIDYGDVVVHVFSPTTRDYYRLEKVWGDATLVLRMQ